MKPVVLVLCAVLLAAPSTASAAFDLEPTMSDSPDPVVLGTELTYTIVVNKTGADSASNVTLTDELPDGTAFLDLTAPAGWSCVPMPVGESTPVSCTIATLSAATSTFTLVVDTDAVTFHLENTATVSAAGQTSTANDSVTEFTQATSNADAAVDVSDTPDPVVAGNTFTYTASVTNNGPTASNFGITAVWPLATEVVSLDLPTNNTWSCNVDIGTSLNCSLVDDFLHGGATNTAMIGLRVDPATPNGTTLSTTFTTDDPGDPVPANDSETATTAVVTRADLSASISDPVATASLGEDVTYTIGLSTAGPSDAQNASVALPVPAGMRFKSLAAPAGYTCAMPAVGATGTVSCSRAVLAAASPTATFTLVLTVADDAANLASPMLTATADSATVDPDPSDDADTATTRVRRIADLSVAVTDAPDPVAAGGTIAYTVTVGQGGPHTARDVTVGFALPAGSSLVSVAPAPGFTCVATTCTAATLGVGSSTFTVVVRAPASGPAAFTAFVGGAVDDPNTSDAIASTTTAVTRAADPPSAGPPAIVPGPIVALPRPPVVRAIVCRRVPNLRRLTITQARRALRRASCRVTLRRTGRVRKGRRNRITRQTPRAGSVLRVGDRLTVRIN